MGRVRIPRAACRRRGAPKGEECARGATRGGPVEAAVEPWQIMPRRVRAVPGSAMSRGLGRALVQVVMVVIRGGRHANPIRAELRLGLRTHSVAITIVLAVVLGSAASAIITFLVLRLCCVLVAIVRRCIHARHLARRVW